MNNLRQRFHDPHCQRGEILNYIIQRFQDVRNEGINIRFWVAQASYKVLPGARQHGQGTLNRSGGFLRGIAGHSHHFHVVNKGLLCVRKVSNYIIGRLAVRCVPFVDLINYFLKALFRGLDADLEIVQHGVVGLHNAVKGVLNCFLAITSSCHNISFGLYNSMCQLCGRFLVAAQGFFQPGCETIHLLQVLILRHLHGFVGFAGVFGDGFIGCPEHQFSATSELFEFAVGFSNILAQLNSCRPRRQGSRADCLHCGPGSGRQFPEKAL